MRCGWLNGWVRGFGRCVAVVLVLGSAPAWAQVKVLINPGDQAEQSRFSIYRKWEVALQTAFNKERVGPINVQLSTDATADLRLTRSRVPDVFVAPAHVIGSAVRFNYVPVAGQEGKVQTVLVALKDSAINSLAAAKGKRLGLPTQDSIVTYLLRGELNAENTTLKRHFSALYETRYQDALLPCLQLNRCDVVAVERAVAERWLSTQQAVKIVAESKPTPALSMAVKEGIKPGAAALRAAVQEAMGSDTKLVALTAADFDYVSTLGYFTPRALPGVNVPTAQEVASLLKGGAVYIDTRTDVEFKAGHVPGAKLVPYVEKSAKDADYVASEDQFDLSQLPANKATPVVLACNGAECWKSYKAAVAAKQAGHTQVYWFRGGFPEWRAAGLPVDGG